MKVLVLLGDGMADFPVASLDNKTPLEVANTPAMDSIAQSGIAGLFKPIPDAFPAGSDIGNLSVFGYDPHETFTGRAPLEAINQGIALNDSQLAFRCNLVTLDDGAMRDFTADHISTEDARALIVSLNEKMTQPGLTFHAGVGYRHLLIIEPESSVYDSLAELECTPPHDITDQNVAPYHRLRRYPSLSCDLHLRSN